ncbi:hypothetical protein A3C20_03200 [Candidatus Kaiserbacteria bacterium RIFCSPHIGHO2_02_FULL_55_25]|uniref:Glycerophosphoryl diester phosphodiesterase membrane domain-containing protein n=1 Tax=Candidatus Kaiserbacteria bacterium RIFCSPHIGHO2_02_FULL_55_25 TaxID=1798498 RepID=A0A1F6E7V4_9BACT|nr:MAG: hypothetical protein A2764_01990 [Candidatus Kaiserbacteria bacterium RIFCSPHIGHO2_01_FULL_55_79]OGG69272.1 MAG: hypothetical protein A3C20_03200 [Candidatus Kaiserbacteria bacterium RIFCSPHIGHO2_02_FULL_55_25]OGG77037.1 MAG: hypothetical protein A3F56_01085 [Candidatus Kaiserbacteria bacterium RIFCSPHIGHO2_12_FULL_55_13]OGG83906.1 MAG: hypothetical protein A3A42_00205 [Candidatus Kaiserbacteria bacterium RIFCSPLOWO2_01_FULL_55_25]
MLRFGWETFKKRPWFFIGVMAVIWVVSGVFSQMSSYANETSGAAVVFALVGVFVGVVGQLLVKMGTISFTLKAHDAPEAARFEDLWAPEKFWSYFLASILVGLIVVVGILLLIVPGIMWALRFMFVPYLIIDRKLDVSAAMRESSRITLGHKWQLLGLVVVLGLLNILGLLALVVGLLVTVPVTMLAVVHAYRTLEHSASEVALAPAV